MRKEFSEKLHEENDPETRKRVKLYFLLHDGIVLKENPDQYGIDLLQIVDDKVLAGYEVERRHNWKGKDFPFDTVNIPERKLKFAELGYPTYYLATNKTMDKALLMPFKVLAEAQIQEQKNKFVGQGEFFYKVPLENTEILDLTFEGYKIDN